MPLAKRLLFPLFTIIIIIILYFIEIPYSISANVKLVPAKEWSFVRNANGLFNIYLYDHLQQKVESIKTIEFERGLLGQIEPAANMLNGSNVSKGDTLIIFEDAMLRERYLQLMGQIEITRARVNAGFTGEEEALIPEAQKELDYARAALKGQQKIFERVEKLYANDLITRIEYDIELNNLELAQESVKLAEAQLKAIETGQEEAFLKVLKAELAAYENEAEFLKERLDKNSIISPINGKVLFDAFSDTMMQVLDTGSIIGYVPLKLSDQQYINKEDSVIVNYNSGKILRGVVKNKQSKTQIHQGEQISINICVFNNDFPDNPGIILPCRIETKNINILEYLQRKVF